MNKSKILIVDDEEINLKVLEITFSTKYQVLTSENGEDALNVLNNHPDIEFVISDMRMPIMDGLEFIKKVKKNNKDLPCMLLSGYEQTTEIYSALKDNLIVAYMMKPFKKTEIEELIETHTNS